jgi:cyclophilin family peptidyl-prolyl cis-trans isomerase
MNRKINIFGLFAITALLICGCVKKETQTNADQKQVKQEQQISETKQIERNTVSVENKKVKLQTSIGDIVIELNAEKAPVSVQNFLVYVESGFYNGLIFHRVIKGFMIQGGGFTQGMEQKKTNPAIKIESANGLKNDRGTVAMARTSVPDSATSQFFINHVTNDSLNYRGPSNPGYAVFGKVTEGMDVVDKIASVKTTVRNGMSDVPVDMVTIISATVIKN